MKQLLMFEDPKPRYSYDDLKQMAEMLHIKAPKNPKNYEWLRNRIFYAVKPKVEPCLKNADGFTSMFMCDYPELTIFYADYRDGLV